MRIKNLKTNLEGEAKDIPFWNKMLESASVRGDIYVCSRTYKPCRDVINHNCVYQERFRILEEKEE